jgi:5'-phosphate synthase pdxT subunit
MKIGVLALQGDFREHLDSLNHCGARAVLVKTQSEIESIDALVIPGGESTTIAKLARSFNLFDLIVQRINSGMPTYGSCAGMILLADRVEDAAKGQETFGGIDMTVRRNAFGRQVESFEREIFVTGITGPALNGIFIRAPFVESVGPDVEVLASLDFQGKSHPVAVKHRHLLATSFHPEITGDHRLHQLFLDSI